MASGRRANDTLVLLSTYNGARYVEEQIESIRAQTLTDWTLLVRDDGSSDETAAIVRRLAGRDERLQLLVDDRGNVGPWASFARLIAAAAQSSASYVFFSDQDDIWLPSKMADQLELLRTVESTHDAGQPVLVHSDLEVVDDDLRSIHPSFEKFQRMSYDPVDPLGTLLLHNAVVGCTIAINRPLLELANPLPRGSAHDWWLALCAAAAGSIRSMPEATVCYRQHASNAVGARSRHSFLTDLVTHPLRFASRGFDAFKVGVDQAAHLAERLRDSASSGDRARRVTEYSAAFGSGPLPLRLRALRSSRAKPRRRTARLILYGIVAAYPHVFPCQSP